MNRVFAFLIGVSFLVAAGREFAFLLPAGGVAGISPESVAWLRSIANFAVVDGKTVAPMDQVTNAVFDNAKKAVELAIKFVGGTALFLGLMKIVEAGGGLAMVARVIRPLLVRLFPDVPPDHPAMGAMIMNLAANALGLGNAATPFGLKAMHELDKLNPHKGTATNAMALFLTINTSGVTLLATGVIVARRELGSLDPAAIQMTTLFSTFCSTVFGVLACFLLARFFPSPPATDAIDAGATESADAGYPLWVSLAAIGSVLGLFVVGLPMAAIQAPWVVDAFTRWLIPALVVGFVGFGFARGVPVYEVFVQGARDGFDVAVRIIPYLVAILVAVGMFTASGALDSLSSVVGPFTRMLGLPPEALPMALIRPLSGSGASGIMLATMSNPATGPDTYTGYLVSTIQGSTETTFYVLSVYFGAIGVQRVRHTLPAALLADMMGLVASIVAVQAYFRWVLGVVP